MSPEMEAEYRRHAAILLEEFYCKRNCVFELGKYCDICWVDKVIRELRDEK